MPETYMNEPIMREVTIGRITVQCIDCGFIFSTPPVIPCPHCFSKNNKQLPDSKIEKATRVKPVQIGDSIEIPTCTGVTIGISKEDL